MTTSLLLADYKTREGYFDELLAQTGIPREHAAA